MFKFSLSSICAMTVILAISLSASAMAKGERVKPSPEAVRIAAENIVWYSQSSLMIPASVTGGPMIYTDPVGGKVPKDKPGDIVLISHSHGDHFVPDDVRKVSKEATLVYGPKDCKVKGNFSEILPGQSVTPYDGVRIEAVPAYNTNKSYHTKASNWCGFIIEAKGIRIYFAGDTDIIPEMGSMDVDIAILPVGGTYTMTYKEAVQAALTLEAQVAIPMHYGSVVGKKADALEFKKLLEGKIEVMVK